MDKEITSINNHQTFVVLEDHEPLPDGYKKYHIILYSMLNLMEERRVD